MDKVEIIPGVLITPLKKIVGASGSVMHGLKASEESFKGFGEAYFSTVESGSIKPWKRHLTMTLNLIVPVGSIRFILVDDRRLGAEPIYMDITLSSANYFRLTVPPKVWVAFQGKSETGSNMLLNIADLEHDPNELERADLNKFSFSWMSE